MRPPDVLRDMAEQFLLLADQQDDTALRAGYAKLSAIYVRLAEQAEAGQSASFTHGTSEAVNRRA